MRVIGSREFNQDVSQVKRMARIEPVVVTDRGRPTHVLLSIEAFRQLSGERESIVELLAVPDEDGGFQEEGRFRESVGPAPDASLMFLLDTDVVLELRRAKTDAADPGLVAWAQSVARERLFLSALTLLDLEAAPGRSARKLANDPAGLRRWIDDQLMPAFDGRILPVDAAVARRRSQLPYADMRDGLLAATALEHGLTLVTRDVAAFRAGRVKLFNPWGYSPDAVEEGDDWRQVARSGPIWLKNLFVRT